MKKHKAEIGTVSHGTMRDEDLIPRFLNYIQWLDPKRITKLRKDPEWRIITNWFKNHADDDLRGCTKRIFAYHKKKGTVSVAAKIWHESFYWSEYTFQLFDVLNEYAPPYCSFGSSEGDGSDYGFWPYSWTEIKHDTDALIVSDLSEVWRGYRGEVFHVNDHGNITLYTCNSKGKLTEIWGVV